MLTLMGWRLSEIRKLRSQVGGHAVEAGVLSASLERGGESVDHFGELPAASFGLGRDPEGYAKTSVPLKLPITNQLSANVTETPAPS